jgi:hypothetical protein
MLKQLASLARLDFSPRHRQPSAGRLAAATIASIAGSLAADALLVVIGTAIFPGTRGFAHFQFPDYARLTVAGSGTPRRLPSQPPAASTGTPADPCPLTRDR